METRNKQDAIGRNEKKREEENFGFQKLPWPPFWISLPSFLF